MRRSALHACLTLFCLLAVPAAVAGSAVPAAKGAPPQPEQPNAREAARAAIGAIDLDRLVRDPAYAAEILRHLDVIEGDSGDPRFAEAVDILRLNALVSLRRSDEARVVIDRILARRPGQAQPYAAILFAAGAIGDYERAVVIVEQASRNIRGVGWPELQRMLGSQLPWLILSQFEQRGQNGLRVRLADALFRIGWPGHDDREGADALRMILLDDRLRQGDTAGAAGLAAGLSTPGSVLRLILLRRYDVVLGPGADRLALLGRVLAAYDRETARAVSGAEPSRARILDRAQLLAALGRYAEAAALLAPFTIDVAATVAQDEYGIWLVNAHVGLLFDLDRRDEAVALMNRLLALPIADNPNLIGPQINAIALLNLAGRPDEGLALAQRLDGEAGRANAYGRMWISAGIVCALDQLGRRAEAAPRLAQMRAGGDDNFKAMAIAYLCVDDVAAAEATVIRWLQSGTAEYAVLDLQDFQFDSDNDTDQDSVWARFWRLRERPAVRAELDRVGRVLPLPLAGNPWS